MKILVNIQDGSFPGNSYWHTAKGTPMRIQAFSDSRVMTSYCQKDVLTKGKSCDRTITGRLGTPTKISPEKPFKSVKSFDSNDSSEKSKLVSDFQTRYRSEFSDSYVSTSSSSSSYISLSKPIYSSRSRTELELKRLPTLELEDCKKVGSLDNSPKWSRIKEAFEVLEPELPLSKTFSRSTSSLPRPLARQLAAVTVKRTESCDRGSSYRPRGMVSKGKNDDLEDRYERISSRINFDVPPKKLVTRESTETKQKHLDPTNRFGNSRQSSYTEIKGTCKGSIDFDTDKLSSSTNRFLDFDRTPKVSSCEKYSSKISRTSSCRSKISDSEERFTSSKSSSSKRDDLSLSRTKKSDYNSDTELLNTRCTLPDMESINSLKSYLKEIKDSKLKRELILKGNNVTKDSLSLNVSLSVSPSTDFDIKRSKSVLTSCTDLKPSSRLTSSREYRTIVTERESYLDWETKATQNYLKKLEETRLGRLKVKKKLQSDLQDKSRTNIKGITSECAISEDTCATELMFKNTSNIKLSESESNIRSLSGSIISSTVTVSPKKSNSPTLPRPVSVVSPLCENNTALGKLERGLTFHGSLSSSKNNMQGWKMTSSGSWIKVTVEKEVFGTSIKSKVALLAHQFDHLNSGSSENGSASKELILYKEQDHFHEKPKLTCHTLDAICCPLFMTNDNTEESKPSVNIITTEKVITNESKKLGLVKQVVQNFEESVQKTTSSSESETSTTPTKCKTGHLHKTSTKTSWNRSSRKNDRESLKGKKGDISSPRTQRHSSSNDVKSHSQDEKEDRTYSSFAGKSKLPSNHKLTIPPRLSSMRNGTSLLKTTHQRPSIPPPRKPVKGDSLNTSKTVTTVSEGESSLLAELEKWLVQKYDHKEQQERQPNESFLWKKVPRRSSDGSDVSSQHNNDKESVESYYSRPFAHTVDGEEHIYMEASFVRPHSANEVFVPGNSCDSDEGWVDVDEAELEHIAEEAKDINTEVHFRTRPKNIKTHCVRRSWIQSVREKSLSGEEHTQKDYKDISVWETEEGDASSSSSTSSDHLYETLYDVIMPEESAEQELTSDIVSTEDLTCFSEEITNSSNIVQGGKVPDSPRDEQGLKKNWSLAKSDISLQVTSNLNNLKVRKDTQSTTDILQPQSDSGMVPSKKKTLIKFILRQKSNTAAKKRVHKKRATFYVRWSKVDRESRGCNGQTESNDVSPERHSEVDGKKFATVRRRPSNPVRRPTTPPPLPPIAGGQVRTHEGTKSLESIRSTSASSPNKASCKKKTQSLDSAQCIKLDQGNRDTLCRNDSFVARSSCSSSDSPSSSSQSSHDNPNGNSFFVMPKSRGSITSSLSSHSGNSYIPEDEIASIPKPNSLPLPTTEEEACYYLQLKKDLQQYQPNLRSPFEEEPLYQFYTKGVKQRATKLQTLVMMDEEQDVLQDMVPSPGSVSSSSSAIPSAMQLLHHDIGNQRTLWCEVPEVRNSGIVEQITMQERKLQEAMFEVITSEASYLKSLNVLIEHFMECPEFSDDFSMNCVLGRRERHVLFSDVIPVQEVSIRLLNDLEQRWQENILISNICDILYEHASKFFQVYVKYCANQVYQDRILKEMKATRPDFINVLQRLECNPITQGLDMHSFLMLPMQRITRMPLLVDAIFHRLTTDSPYYDICKLTLVTLNKVVAECNEAARKMERMEEMLVISRQLDFKDCKSIPLISASRWLVKKGELVRLVYENFGRNKTFGRSTRYTKIPTYVFLFTDLLLITKKKSDDAFVVLDYCPRNLVQVFTLEDAGVSMPGKVPDTHKNVFQLTMLQNHEFKTVELILGCPLESDRTRWMEAVTPPVSENPDEKIYEEWDCPQVQCVYPYTAKQPDELTLEESDVVNVFRKMPDGWHEGERLRDGVKGWFPASFTVEIISSHIRARNLRQRYRLLMLSQAYVEEQRKAFLLDKSDKSK